MPVPEFDGRGLLPPYLGANSAATGYRSPYPSLITELVSSLGSTPERCNLLYGLLQYRRLLQSFGYVDGIQFIDGSFVEDIETREGRAPRDIDIFSFLVRPAQYHRNDVLWQSIGFPQWVGEIVNQRLNKQRYQLDTYAIAVDQTAPLQLMNETIYWYSLFSHKRVTQGVLLKETETSLSVRITTRVNENCAGQRLNCFINLQQQGIISNVPARLLSRNDQSPSPSLRGGFI